MFSHAANSKRALIFFAYLYGEYEKMCFKTSSSPTVNKKVARPKSRLALRATRPSAAVAENGYFDQNVAPAQKLIISLLPYSGFPVLSRRPVAATPVGCDSDRLISRDV